MVFTVSAKVKGIYCAGRCSLYRLLGNNAKIVSDRFHRCSTPKRAAMRGAGGRCTATPRFHVAFA
jgi:hypothetical protein